eukprot:TRINITY_DN4015_c0_g2_i2.p1 TRINITY_DN4015_c0_g2~~TRINITY_DN4015_c0_g2_i2.p1  ORF type:complete len:353 (+),score=56.87 TRINITY_DN4015_c0_g2_i2:40-1059(+)
MGKPDYAARVKQEYAGMGKPDYAARVKQEYAGMGNQDYAGMGKPDYAARVKQEYAGMGKPDYAARVKQEYAGMGKPDYAARAKPDYAARVKQHYARDSQSYTNSCQKQDSSRHGVTCTQPSPFSTVPCQQPGTYPSAEEEKARMCTAQLLEARAAARRKPAAAADGKKPRRRNHGIPSTVWRTIENGGRVEDLPGRSDPPPPPEAADDQPAPENKSSLETVDSSGSSDRVKPNIQELLENTSHQMDMSHPKRWVCEACNETILIALSRNLVAFLTRPCEPGPPPWMHPTHHYTRDVGKILCNVCFGFSNGLRASPKLRKPCPGPPGRCEGVSGVEDNRA